MWVIKQEDSVILERRTNVPKDKSKESKKGV